MSTALHAIMSQCLLVCLPGLLERDLVFFLVEATQVEVKLVHRFKRLFHVLHATAN